MLGQTDALQFMRVTWKYREFTLKIYVGRRVGEFDSIKLERHEGNVTP